MEATHVFQLLVLALLICCSAFFSSSEASLFSLGKVRLQALVDRGHPRAPVLQRLLDRPRRLLVTILIGNELVNIGAAVTTASFWEGVLGHEYGFWTVTTISTATVLPLLLLFGEVIPKTVAVKNDEGVALFVARPLLLFYRAITPARWVLRRIAEFIVRLFGREPQSALRPASEAEFKRLLDVGKLEGVVEELEHTWIRNVFEFDDRRLDRIMTPADRIFSLPIETPAPELLMRIREAGYSRIPIYRNTPKNIVGVLFAKDLLRFGRPGAQQRLPSLRRIMREPIFFPRDLSAADVFRELRARRKHFALVVDERGALRGLVTMEDVLEELFGEIEDERDRDEAEEDSGESLVPEGLRSDEAAPPRLLGERKDR